MDYDDQATIVAALAGQDFLIITMSVRAAPTVKAALFAAAAAAHVQWVLPNEFGIDSLNTDAGHDAFFEPARSQSRLEIENLGLNWVGICSGFWYEFSLGGGSQRYGFDFAKKVLTYYDDGETRFNTTTWPLTGQAVANLLALPILPKDENDTQTTLQDFRNSMARISSFAVTQKELFASVLRVTGDKESDWKIDFRTSKDCYEEGVKLLKEGNMQLGFTKLLYARYTYPDGVGLFEIQGLDNKRLGLGKEDLDEFTEKAIEGAKGNTFGMPSH